MTRARPHFTGVGRSGIQVVVEQLAAQWALTTICGVAAS